MTGGKSSYEIVYIIIDDVTQDTIIRKCKLWQDPKENGDRITTQSLDALMEWVELRSELLDFSWFPIDAQDIKKFFYGRIKPTKQKIWITVDQDGMVYESERYNIPR